MKKCSKLYSEARTRGWISRVARSLQAVRRCTRVKHAEKLNRHANCSTTGQKVLSGHLVGSQLGLTTQSNLEAKSPVHSVMERLNLRIPFSLQYKYPLYPRNIESFQRILKEKPQRKTRLTHPQSLHSDSSNSSTLTLSIITSLRGTLAKTFSHHTHIYEKAIWYLGSSQEGTNCYWLMLQVIAESGKLKKTKGSAQPRQSKKLGGLRYTGQIRLRRCSAVHVSQLHSLVDY